MSIMAPEPEIPAPDPQAHAAGALEQAGEGHAVARRHIRRLLVKFTWLRTVAAALLLAFSYLLPQDLRRTGRVYTPAVAVAFYGRTFTFHTGVALLTAGVVGVALRPRRLGLLAFMAAVVALAPTAWSYVPRDPPPPAPDAPS